MLAGARLLIETRAGLILQAIRDDQNRARYLGFDVPVYQTFFFAVSAGIAGLAGMFYVVVSEFASPTFMDLTFSITMVVWAAVGGRSSILGACIGAIVINMISATVSETEGFAEAWKVIIGLIFVLVVLYLPRGFAGLAHDLVDRFAQPRQGRFAAGGRGRRRLATGGVARMTRLRLPSMGLASTSAAFKAVNGVSLTVEEGELRVLLGANGAGKTTLMDLVSGKTKMHGGRVFLHDTDITNWEEHKIARAGVGRKFQIPSMFKELTVRRNLEVASCRNPGVLRQSAASVSASSRARRDRRGAGADRPDRRSQPAGRLSQPRPNPMARAWPSDHAKSKDDPARRTDRRHDAGGDPKDLADRQQPQGQAHA